MAHSYSAYLIRDRDLALGEVWSLIPPTWPERVDFHHVTFEFPSAELPPDVASAYIVGRAINERADALVMAIDGSTERPDGGIWHITYSLASGVSPKDSNGAIAAGWKTLDHDIHLSLIPAVLA